MRRRAISAAAAFSGSLAVFCLGTAFAGGRPAPVLGFLAGLTAAGALARAVRSPESEPAALRLCPLRGLRLAEDGDGEPELVPISVTRNLICLARSQGGRRWRSIWRDSVAPDGFRRIAALALWRREKAPNPAANRDEGSELIRSKAVTEGQSIERTAGPPGP
jgi:hypothetical protein